MDDVLIVGAGPAGSVAATVLARAGARVRIVDRAMFPRDKLCGDSINPGTLALLRRLGLAEAIEGAALRVDGMVVSGSTGRRIVSIEARYPRGLYGLSISRRDLDWMLLETALQAGASFEPRVKVREALVTDRHHRSLVTGVTTVVNGRTRALRAGVTIAADGRRSAIASSLGLLGVRATSRRWAVGAYVEHGSSPRPLGEMHIRRDRYIGVAPIPGGLVNVCLVKPSGPGDVDLGRPELTIGRALEADAALRERFGGLRLVRPPIVLGPLAVDATGGGLDGLIAAGDAAGFIDPMTGDGLRFAVRGGELAAFAALRVLANGWAGVHAALAAERQREFAAKCRFNRTLRAAVGRPAALRAATCGLRLVPGILHAIVHYAGDCGHAGEVTPDGECHAMARPLQDARTRGD